MMEDNVVILADRRPAPPAAAEDLVASALAALPRAAGLAVRVRTMIDAGASDVFVDVYIVTWVDSARDDLDANRHLHLELARQLGALA